MTRGFMFAVPFKLSAPLSLWDGTRRGRGSAALRAARAPSSWLEGRGARLRAGRALGNDFLPRRWESRECVGDAARGVGHLGKGI